MVPPSAEAARTSRSRGVSGLSPSARAAAARSGSMTSSPARTRRMVWVSLSAGESLTRNADTPDSIARRRKPGRPNVVKMTILIPGWTFFSSAAAASPSRPGISMSSTATSGWVSCAALTTSSPRPTWATTSMSPSKDSRAASASLIMTWSSASSSRTGASVVIAVYRDRGGQLEAVGLAEIGAGFGRPERQAAAFGGQPFGHAAQPCSVGRARVLAARAVAVVGDLEGQFAGVLDQADPARLGAGVADHVGDRLAQAPGQHRLRVGVERARPQGQPGIVVEPDAGRVQRVARGDDLDRERGATVTADRLPDVVQRLPADPADVAEVAEHRVAFLGGRQLGQPLGGQFRLQRDHRQRLTGQVVHVPGQAEPSLVRG